MAEQHPQPRAEHVPLKVQAGGSTNPNKAPNTAPPITNTRPKPTENKGK